MQKHRFRLSTPRCLTIYNRDWGMQIAHFCLTWDFQGGKQNIFHPLSFKSDQHVFSPNYINTLSRKKVGRINKMMNKGEMLWFLTKFSRLILYGNVWTLVWRICIWILGLKGLTNKVNSLQQGHLGIGTKCPSQSDVLLIESQVRGVKKGRDPGSIKVSEKLPT